MPDSTRKSTFAPHYVRPRSKYFIKVLCMEPPKYLERSCKRQCPPLAHGSPFVLLLTRGEIVNARATATRGHFVVGVPCTQVLWPRLGIVIPSEKFHFSMPLLWLLDFALWRRHRLARPWTTSLPAALVLVMAVWGLSRLLLEDQAHSIYGRVERALLQDVAHHRHLRHL